MSVLEALFERSLLILDFRFHHDPLKALSASPILARLDSSIEDEINRDLEGIISHPRFQRGLNSRNTAVRLPPTTLQIRNTGRENNYLWQIIALRLS